MTDARLPLAELLEKAGESDFLRAVAEAVLQLLMESDVEGLIGAGRYERSAERLNYRNGFRERALDTRLGTLQLRVPKLRQGSYFPPFLEPRKVSEKALVAVIQEAWIGGGLDPAGGRARAGHGALRHLEEHGLQAVQGHRRARERLPRPPAGGRVAVPVAGRDLPEGREGGRIVSVAAIIAVAVDTEGRREIVGLHLGPSEAETFWATFLRSLVRRGLEGRQARGLGRPRGPQGRDPARAGRHLAALPSPLDEERLGARGQGPAGGGRRRAPAGVPAGRRGAPRTRSGGRWPTSCGRAGPSSPR